MTLGCAAKLDLDLMVDISPIVGTVQKRLEVSQVCIDGYLSATTCQAITLKLSDALLIDP